MTGLPPRRCLPGRAVSCAPWLYLALCLLLLAAGSAPARAQETAPAAPSAAAPAPAPPVIDNGRCLGCHDDPTLKDVAGRSLNLPAATFQVSAHRKLACTDCHADALSVRHPRQPLGAVQQTACASCHQDETDKLAASVHGKKGMSPALCVSCHGDLHAVQRSSDPSSPVSAVNQVRGCGRCHQPMMQGYLSSPHARALLASGLDSAPACTSCHGSGHEIRVAADPAAATSFARSPDTCGTCHAGILRQWTDSAHGKLWQQGAKNGPVCISCHQAHAIQTPTSGLMRERFPSDCGTCHAKLYASFHDSFHGKAGSLGFTAVAMCSDCHTPHHNLPPSDRRSTVNAANLAATCGKCHPREINAQFLSFDPHADPQDPKRNVYVHWVWVAMTALLLGVFGFFGLHDLLWLQRTLVGTLRGEYPRRSSSGPYVRRFTGTQIFLHVVVVVSFLLLAATGLPLKFASAPWAPQLMALWGGPHPAGILHRIAAVVTFAYFGGHVFGVLFQSLIKRESGYFWGPRSMVPQPADIRDLFANLGYFLYLRPAPKLDRWSYWEKFDYLAVFWGVAMIGVTGLMLWFPGFVTRFLPGWVLNAAYIAHSDEALLATGFIFVFHFFHTHLRPQVFPMDPVVFTGRLPLERFKEERPLEYQRLAAAGKLETLAAAPPTTGEMTRAYIFGYCAVAIGVLLAIGIFVALLGYVR